MQSRHIALLLGIAAAEFYEPCTPAQALQALHKVRSLDAASVQHQADANKLQNLSTALTNSQDKFTDLQRRIGFTGQVALCLADERRIDSLTDRTVGLMSEVFFYFKELHTMPLYKMLVENHNTCLLDIFAGRCEKRNLPIFEKFPAVQGPPQEGFMLDFLGVSMPIKASCERPQLALLAPGRTMMCRYYLAGMPLPRVWPVLDEEYLEWADSLTTAVDAARAGRPFRMAELGSGPYGIWAMRAAKAYTKFVATDQPCQLYHIGDGSILQTHTAMNLPLGRCKFLVHTELLSTSEQLKALLGSGGVWDLVDIDAQGAEEYILSGLLGWLSTRVRRLHVSTHSRRIHWQLLDELRRDGWQVKKLQKKHFNARQIQDPELRKRFDTKKSLKKNLESTNLKEMYKERLPKKVPKKAAHPQKVNEEEAPICKKLVEKYGTDYEKMHWDVKINIFQWTPKICEKKVKAYNGGKLRSMSGEILSGHGIDFRRPIYGKAKNRNVFGLPRPPRQLLPEDAQIKQMPVPAAPKSAAVVHEGTVAAARTDGLAAHELWEGLGEVPEGLEKGFRSLLILGPSGSGKSTLLRSILKKYFPDFTGPLYPSTEWAHGFAIIEAFEGADRG
ncbi:kidins220, partial [Symbiodinium microadriaticum]